MPRHTRTGLRAVLVTSVLVLGLLGQTSAVYASVPNSLGNRPFGKTYDQWAAEWWKWVLSIPVDRSPYIETTGEFCAEGQSGHVWHLAGYISDGTVHRSCTIPAGQAISAPSLNVECSNAEAPPFYGGNEEELRACVEAILPFTNQHFEVDGQSIAVHDVESPLYQFTVPTDNFLGVPAGTYISVAAGGHVLVPPLPVGHHEISFGGTAPAFGGFTWDIHFDITVAP